MKSIITCIGIVSLGFVLGACNMGVQGSGNVISESRNVSDFSSIELATVGTLTVEQTGTESLTIQAEDNISPLLTSDIAGGTLILGTKPNTSFTNTKPILYKLTVKDLKSVKLSGSGDATLSPLKTDELSATVSGSGSVKFSTVTVSNALTLTLSGSGGIRADSLDSHDTHITVSGSGRIEVPGLSTGTIDAVLSGNGNVTVAGKADSQTVNASGSGSYKADNLESKQAQVVLPGSGHLTINASDKLDVTISGSGSVTYLGNPTLSQRITGSGTVNKG